MRTSNVVRTALLLGALTALFALAGHLIGGRGGMLVALAVALVMNGAAYLFGDRLVLAMARARQVAPDEEPRLFALVTELARRSRIPAPKVYLIDSPSPNAFATGRDPSHAAVAVTTGLFRVLDPHELEAVLAHEVAHIRARDTLLVGVAAALAGAMVGLPGMFEHGPPMGPRDEDGRRGGLIAGILMLLVAPIAAMLLQLALSRARESEADATGARLCGDPSALASALRRLQQGTWLRPLPISPAAAPLFIVPPFNGLGILRLFNTHPPTGERIAHLDAMARLYGRRAGAPLRQVRTI